MFEWIKNLICGPAETNTVQFVGSYKDVLDGVSVGEVNISPDANSTVDFETIEPAVVKSKEDIFWDDLEKSTQDKCKEIEAELLTKKAELLQKYQDEHNTDVTNFKFECKRYGDFLTIYVERFIYTDKIDNHCSAIPLRNLSQIRFIEGNIPDENGVLNYNVVYTRERESRNVYNYGPGKIIGLQEVAPLEHFDDWNRIFELSGQSSDAKRRRYSNRPIAKYKTENYPRMAEDDVIALDTIGNLYIPAGLGKGVYDTIMNEMGDYFQKTLGVK